MKNLINCNIVVVITGDWFNCVEFGFGVLGAEQKKKCKKVKNKIVFTLWKHIVIWVYICYAWAYVNQKP